MTPQRGSLPIITLVIVVVLVVIFGFFFNRNSTNTQQPQSTPTPPTQQTSTSPSGLNFDNPPVKFDPHQVFLAKSPDGVNFTKEDGVLFDKASVPDIIRLPNGRLFVYAVDGAGRSKSGVMVAFSDDNGQSWAKGSLQLKKRFGIADPEAITLRDGRIRIYFVTFEAGKSKILSAISEDGINFTEEEGVRFEYLKITDPDIVDINGKLFMYLSQGHKLIATTSDDGLTFNFEGVIREKGSVSNTVYVDVNLYRQFYCFGGNIKSATSANGLTFKDEEGFRLTADPGKIICDPAPVHLGGSWIMLYKTL